MDGVIAAGLEAEGPLRDRVSFRWWISFLMEGRGDYWVSYLKTPEVLICCLLAGCKAPHSPGSSPLPPAPPHSALPSDSTLQTSPVLTEGPPPDYAHRDEEGEGALPLPHSLEDSTLLQAVLATIPHGCIVHSLNGPVNGLEDILLQALGRGKDGRLDLGA